MTLLLDIEPHTVSEARNKVFRRKTSVGNIQDILDAAGHTTPWALYGFQKDSLAGTNVDNEQGDAAADITLNAAGMWTGAGWYVYPAGNGSGLQNDGGVSGNFGLISDCTNINLAGASQATVLMRVKLDSAGEAGFGHIFIKDLAIRLFFFNANVLLCNVYAAGAPHGTQTSAVVTYGEWHDIAVVFDGSLAGDVARLKIYVNGQDVTQVSFQPGIPATLEDPGNDMYLMDRQANDLATNGQLGFMAVIPGYAFTQANIDSMGEIRIMQPTAASQPVIRSPGLLGIPNYDFDGTNDNFFTDTIADIATAQGSLLIWLSLSDLTAGRGIVGFTTWDGNDDEFTLSQAGADAGDPFRIQLRINAANSWRADFGANILDRIGISFFIALTSDGSVVRSFIDGNEVTLTDAIGANSGQWFASAPDANRFSIGARWRSSAIFSAHQGDIAKYIQYNRALAPIEIEQIYQRNVGIGGVRWYPDR